MYMRACCERIRVHTKNRKMMPTLVCKHDLYMPLLPFDYKVQQLDNKRRQQAHVLITFSL